MDSKKHPRPEINSKECKGCERCVVACPKQVLKMSPELNERGYHYVTYSGEGCIGCANCYYTCPEPHALKVRIPKKE
ncbi:MAG: 4Fe-4S dicluster domain-containing protein [Candidatus Altiarchaeia archaeon]